MKQILVDAAYFIALANPNDQWHERSVQRAAETANHDLVTTEDVLIELLNFYAESGDFMRRKVGELTRSILLDSRINIVGRTETTLLDALDLYESRLDKGYSLTDCISMNVCKKLGIEDVLTTDKHFQQEGFNVLL